MNYFCPSSVVPRVGLAGILAVFFVMPVLADGCFDYSEYDPYLASVAGGEGAGWVDASDGICLQLDLDGLLKVLDLSNPSNPLLIGQRQVPVPFDFRVDGSFAMVTGGGEYDFSEIYIFKVFADGTINPFGSNTVTTSSHGFIGSGFAVSGDLALVGGWRQLSYGKIFVYRLRDGGFDEINVIDGPIQPASITMRNNRAFVSSMNKNIQWYDFSNSGELIQSGSLDVGKNGRGLETTGDLLLAVTDYGEFHVIDVSDPENQTVLSTLKLGGYLTEILVSEDTVFVADMYLGIHKIDISDPRVPIHLSTTFTAGGVKQIADFSPFVGAVVPGTGLVVVDPETEFENPVNFVQPIDSHRLDVRGSIALAGGQELRLLDISNPNAPRTIDVENLDAYGTNLGQRFLALGEKLAVFGSQSRGNHPGTVMIEIDPLTGFGESFQLREFRYGYPGFNDAAIDDGFVFLAEIASPYLSNVVIVDVSDPRIPVDVATIPIEGRLLEIELVGDYLYAASISPSLKGLTVIDVSNPTLPEIRSIVELQRYPRTIAVDGDLLCTSSSDVSSMIELFSITDPGRPEYLSEIEVSGFNKGARISDSIIYMQTNSGLVAYDVTNTSNPVETGRFLGPMGGIAIADNQVLVSSRRGLVSLQKQCPLGRPKIEVRIDVKPGSLENPIICNSQKHQAIPVAVLSNTEFDALSIDHTTVRFGSGEASEAHSNRHGTIRHEEDVDRDGDLDLVFHFRLADTGIQCGDTKVTLIGETYDGQQVIGSDIIQTMRKGGKGDLGVKITPNPFNPQTTISFYADQSQGVRVSVYDIRGRRVVELTNQQYQVGEHSVEWQGRDSSGRSVPSGEYFFRIEIGNQVETRKAMLLR